MKHNLLGLALLAVTLFAACNPDPIPGGPGNTSGNLLDIPYAPRPYTIVKPQGFLQILVPDDNLTTHDGVQLGRRLFYDAILSKDSSLSCSSCHLPQGSFTDNLAFSKGVDGLAGRRSAMSLLNVAYADKLFWDGRSPSLEEQALHPVEDPIEMHATWPQVVEKLQRHPAYPALFRKAFGISSTDEITKELTAKALAQFERILISSGNSKYDRLLRGEVEFTDEEIDGKIMFFDGAAAAGVNLPDAQCLHCHKGPLFTENRFFNNALDSVASLDDFRDKGLGEVTKLADDNGKFRAPGLCNIALSAPYMHDGRFQTLEEVLDHYSHNGFGVPNEDPFIRQIGYPLPGTDPVRYSGLTAYQKSAIIAFLHTLTDTTFVNNPDIQSPF